MDIHVFFLCYNESALLPHTVHHYKKYLPSCKITVYDNESTDDSVMIAKSLGCSVLSWSSNNIHNEIEQVNLRNNIWKYVQSGWIIMADMDELVCVTENELRSEMNQGTSIINFVGMEMVGDSARVDLKDIDLQDIKKCVRNDMESKNLCFLRDKIIEMNYGPGSHSCNPQGEIKYSSTIYLNKHMNYLGIPFLLEKLQKRYERNEEMRKYGMNIHYTNDEQEILKRYYDVIHNSFEI